MDIIPKKEKICDTAEDFSMEENDGLEDDFPFPGGAFSGSMLISRGVS